MIRVLFIFIYCYLKLNVFAGDSSNNYNENWSDKFSSKILIRDWITQKGFFESNYKSDYINDIFNPLIDKKEISLILEIGSRDAIDALSLSEFYKAKVYAFECNTEAIEVCKHNIGKNPNIILEEYAVWDKTSLISFYPVVPGGEEFRLGASSLFKIDNEGPFKNRQKQDEITVQAIRLDEWMKNRKIDNIDLLCIDVQGATLQVLRGLGEKITNVKYIIAEVEHQQYYLGQSLAPEVENYLLSQGFTSLAYIDHAHYGGSAGVFDVLFVRNKNF